MRINYHFAVENQTLRLERYEDTDCKQGLTSGGAASAEPTVQSEQQTDLVGPVAGDQNYLWAVFHVDGIWKNVEPVKAVFSYCDKTKQTALTEDETKEQVFYIELTRVSEDCLECQFPGKLLEQAEEFQVGLRGGSRILTTREVVTVRHGCSLDGQPGELGGEDWVSHVERITEEAVLAVEEAKEIKQAAESGQFDGKQGEEGDSAYQIAVKHGFQGTEEEWLQSLGYEHNTEFAALARQVRADAAQVSADAKRAETGATNATAAAEQAEAGATSATAAAKRAEAGATNATEAADRAEASTTSATAAAKRAETGATNATEAAERAETRAASAAEAAKQAETGATSAAEAADRAEAGATSAAAAAKQAETGATSAAKAAERAETGATNATVAAERAETGATSAAAAAERAETGATSATTAAKRAETGATSATEAADRAEAGATSAAAAAKQAETGATSAAEAAKRAETGATSATEAAERAEAGATNAAAAAERAETGATRATTAAERAETGATSATEAAKRAETGATSATESAEQAETGATSAAEAADRAKASATNATAAADRSEAAAVEAQQTVNQLRENVVDNAGSHNALYRGKNLGNAVTPEQYAAIADGTFKDLYIGDFWQIGGVNYRIAAFDYYYGVGDTAFRTHHAVLVPDAPLYKKSINHTATTDGGYAGSGLFGEGLNRAAEIIRAAFPDHVLSHRVYLTNAVTDGIPSAGAWFERTVDLMSEQMVYGGSLFSCGFSGTTVSKMERVEKTQLPLFQLRPDLLITKVRGSYWLRDVVSAIDFAIVGYDGTASCANASAEFGIRPAFLIG